MILTGSVVSIGSILPLAAKREAKPEPGSAPATRAPMPPAMTRPCAPCASAMSPARLPSARQKRSSASAARRSVPASAACHSAAVSRGGAASFCIAARQAWMLTSPGPETIRSAETRTKVWRRRCRMASSTVSSGAQSMWPPSASIT